MVLSEKIASIFKHPFFDRLIVEISILFKK